MIWLIKENCNAFNSRYLFEIISPSLFSGGHCQTIYMYDNAVSDKSLNYYFKHYYLEITLSISVEAKLIVVKSDDY